MRIECNIDEKQSSSPIFTFPSEASEKVLDLCKN